MLMILMPKLALSDSYRLKAALSEQLIVSVKGCGEIGRKGNKAGGTGKGDSREIDN